MTTVDVKIDTKTTHVSVHDFKVSTIYSHVSTVNEIFDYIGVNSGIGDNKLVSLFMSLSLVDELINKLTDARDTLVRERIKANGEIKPNNCCSIIKTTTHSS
jgi:hypothetical protein